MVEIRNFLEATTVEEANKVDLKKYTFIEKVSSPGSFVFKVRQR